MKTQMDYKKYPDANLSPNRAPSVLSTVRKGTTIIRCTCLSEYDKSYGKYPFCGRTPKTEGNIKKMEFKNIREKERDR